MTQHQIQYVIKTAIRLEQEAYELYKAFIDLTKDYLLQTVFSDLMESEAEHKRTFEKMLVTYESAAQEAELKYLNIEGEMLQPAKSIEETMKGIQTVEDALNFAIQKEKDAMGFYSNFKDSISADDQDIIDEIIRTEQAHMKTLMKEKEKLGL